MRNDTREGNKLHHEALKQCEDWVNAKASNKITKGPNLIRKIEKGTINKPSRAKPKKIVLTGMNPTEMLKAVLTQHKKLTRLQIVDLTGLVASSISIAARKLEDDGFLTRGPAGKGNGREVLFTVVEK